VARRRRAKVNERERVRPSSLRSPISRCSCFFPSLAICQWRDYRPISVFIEPRWYYRSFPLLRGNCFTPYRSFNNRALNPLAMPLVYQLRGIRWATDHAAFVAFSRSYRASYDRMQLPSRAPRRSVTSFVVARVHPARCYSEHLRAFVIRTRL